MTANPKIAMIGAGAIGGSISALLDENGYHLMVFDKDNNHVEQVNSHGLLVDGLDGKRVYNNLNFQTELTGEFDIIFLAVKSISTRSAIDELPKHLKPNGVLVSLQNGINNDQIMQKFSIDQYIAGVVGYGASNIEPGHIRITSKEKSFVIGFLNGHVDDRIRLVAEVLGVVGEVTVSTNILGDQWGKLAMNCIINPFCAIYDQTFGENVRNKHIRHQMQKVLAEVIAVGEKSGIQFTKLGKKYDIVKFFALHNYMDEITKHKKSLKNKLLNSFEMFKSKLMLFLIISKHGKIKSSIWQDLQHGLKTEIDYLNGYIEVLGDEHNIETPMNTWVTREIRGLEKRIAMGMTYIEAMNDFSKEKELAYNKLRRSETVTLNKKNNN
ncbi:MAG: 2-dehydropantoate 2-reductase [Bacteroidia bacterium]|nr:2-dehydropantoate 2-reductase [Bacteroidia bacterium]NNK72987.1 2-dehydropantoate 2-reductase [Flavobacteriaceae bacterium]